MTSTMLWVALTTLLFLHMNSVLVVSAHSPSGGPRTSWKHQDVSLLQFSEPDTFNYSTLLVQEKKGVLYVGARESIFELNLRNISVKNKKVVWNVPKEVQVTCAVKGKSLETDCLNYIRVLEADSEDRLYVCGTHAFQPLCDYLSLSDFRLEGRQEDGRGKCPFDPAQSFTTVMVDGNLYSGTAYNFLGSEPIISRNGHPQGMLRTEYSTSWLNEPSFVFADVVRESEGSTFGDDDKIYFFFTEVSVEYEFLEKLLIPRVAQVCKGDLGGQRTLQKKWTSFLKAKLICAVPETNFMFNVVRDVFILKRDNWKESVIYGVFSSQWGNVESSAVCAFNVSAVQTVFSRGKYMQKTTVEQSHTKWVRYNGIPPSPRPGACVSDHERRQNISSSLDLPDKTLQFSRDHPLLEDPVFPISDSPTLVTKDVLYTQIVVERVQALDEKFYDVIFTGTDKGLLHKSVVLGTEIHVIEEIQLFPNSESIKTLVLPSNGALFLYVGSDSAVVQVPTAFCEKYLSCEDCLLARDPYCAWDPMAGACGRVPQEQSLFQGKIIQSLQGDADNCPKGNNLTCKDLQPRWEELGATAKLPCEIRSRAARLEWRVNGSVLQMTSWPYQRTATGLSVHGMGPELQGCYECWALEETGDRSFRWLLRSFALAVATPVSGSEPAAVTHSGSAMTPFGPTVIGAFTSSPHPTTGGNIRKIAPILETHESPSRYQHSDAKMVLLLFLALLFLFLFLAILTYNCYMQYLPTPCLRARAVLLGGKKPPKSKYSTCDAGLVEHRTECQQPNGVQKDGRDSELDKCEVGPAHEACKSMPTEKPFDMDYEVQTVEFADEDVSN